MHRSSLTAKILLLTLVTIVVGIGLVVTYFLRVQNRDLIAEREAGVEQQVSVLYESIKNNMLVGTAPIARGLLTDLKRVESIREITLFRANGQEAFSDDRTIEAVNRMMGWEMFKPDEPLPFPEPQDDEDTGSGGDDYGYGSDSSYGEDYGSDESAVTSTPAPTPATPPPDTLFEDSTAFVEAVRTEARQTLVHDVAGGREVIYYVPLSNDEACTKCHMPAISPDPDVRGVIRVSSSLTDLDSKIRRNTTISVVIWLLVVAALTLLVIQGMRRLVMVPIQHIGAVAGEVAEGHLDVQVSISTEDEIGTLGEQINRMIIGLRERFKLTKFVSRATLEEVVSNEPLALGGEKRTLTVLFSDIRGFTAFSEQRDPDDVMTILNTYMQRQAGIILNAGGDVDQFVGDEILGVFSGPRMAEHAVRAALEIVAAIDAFNAEQQLDVHVGVGIHTGPMIAGNIGAQGDVERLQRTVIGDAVNTGSRICNVARPGEILISEDTYAQIKDNVIVAEARTVTVKGKAQPLTVYPVQGLK